MVQDIATLQASNTAQIYDNVTEDITGTILHDLLRDILDSSINRETDPFTVSNRLLVDPVNGNDGTGRRGDLFRRYLTIQGAEAGALIGDVIHILPGDHVCTTGRGVDGITYYAWDGASVVCTSSMFTGVGISYNVTGKGNFHSTNGFVFYTQNCTVRVEGRLFRGSSGVGGVCYAQGGYMDFNIESYKSGYDGFVMDVSTFPSGGDYIYVKADWGQCQHSQFATIGITNYCTVIGRVNKMTVGWSAVSSSGVCTFNVGGEIRVEGGHMVREGGITDGNGAWHYMHGLSQTGSKTYHNAKTELLSDDGINPGEMRYGYLNESNNDVIFETEEGSYMHSHDFTDATSVPIRHANNTMGAYMLSGTIDQNGDAGSGGVCMRFLNTTNFPTIEFRNCDLKQSGGFASDTVGVAAAMTYIGKLLFRDGAFPVTFTNSITGLEVDY